MPLKSLNWKNSFKNDDNSQVCIHTQTNARNVREKGKKHSYNQKQKLLFFLQVHSLYHHTSVHTYVQVTFFFLHKFHYAKLIFN